MARSSLPPGFRFHPTDLELIMYYLKRKILGKKVCFEAIAEVNLYQFSPWDLPDKSCLKSKDLEWFFFCPRQKKYANGVRTNRGTEKGYWKTTGKDRSVTYKEKTVGMIRTLVFYLGQAPRGERTDWVMHEYRLVDIDLADTGCVQDSFVLCKIFQKSGPGPKNAAQYGAPFIEEEWDEDEDTCAESSLVGGLNPPILGVGNSSNTKAVESTIVPGNACSLHLIEPGKSTAKAVESTIVPGSTYSLSLIEPGSSAARTSASDVRLPIPDNDDLDILLAMFTDENLLASGNDNNEERDIVNPDEVIQAVHSEENDIFTGLENLGNLADLNNGVSNLSGIQEAGDVVDPMLCNEEDAYMELLDLEIPLPFSAGATEFEPLPSDFFSSY